MKLRRISATLAVLGLLSLLLIVALGLRGVRTLRAHDAEMTTLLALHETVTLVSSEVDTLKTQPRPAENIEALSSELTEIRGSLDRWTPASAGANLAVTATDQLLAELDAIRRASLQQTSPGAQPLITTRQSDQMRDATNTLMLAVNRVLVDRQRAGAGAATGSIGILIALGLLLGILAVAALQLIHWRVVRPVSALARLIHTVRTEAPTARAKANRKDEIGDLGAALNRLLDQHQTDERGLIAKQVQLEARTHHLTESQRIGCLGSWASASVTDHIAWSDETYRVTGTDPASYVPTLPRFYDLVHPGDRDRLQATLERPRPEGESLQSEFRLLRPDGQLRHVILKAEAHRDTTRDVTHVVGTLQDITDQIRLASEAEDQHTLLDLAASTAKFAGWIIDLPTNTVRWTGSIADIGQQRPTGTTVTLQDAIQFVQPEYQDVMLASFSNTVSEGTPFDIEIQIRGADGNPLWTRATGAPVRNADGAVVSILGSFQVIDRTKRLEQRAVASADHLQDSLDQVSDGYLTVDQDLNVTFMNRAARRLAQDPASTDALSIQGAFPTLFQGDGITFLQKALQADGPTTTRKRGSNGHTWFEILANRTGNGLVVILRDVTATEDLLRSLEARENEVQLANRSLNRALSASRSLIDSLPSNIAVLNREGTVVDVNEQWRAFGAANGNPDPDYGVGSNYLAVCERAADHEPDAMTVKNGILSVLNDSADSFSHEYPCPGPGGTRWYRLQTKTTGLQSNGDVRAVVMHIDITENMESRERLARIAYEDPLTGLTTRDGFVRELDARVRAHGWPEHGVVLFLDIDNLRSVNDVHGFSSGDIVLKAVAARLQSQLGSEAILGRLNGDTFSAFVPLAGPDDDADTFGARIMESLASEPCPLENTIVDLSFHAGITSLGDRERPTTELLKEAQLALYSIDRDPTIQLVQFTSDLDRLSRERNQLTLELRRALQNNEFQLHYQPKVDLATGTLNAAEALIRWNHPERGLLAPGAFIPAAEQNGLITPIGSWVLNEACRALRRWQDEGLHLIRIAVNASVEQFRTGRFATEVQRAVEHHGIAPASLTIEITESVFVTEVALLKTQLDQLRHIGVQLALDDFGKGFSSLSYLKDFRFDYLKIDYAFIKDMLEDDYSHAVVRSCIQLAESLGAEPIAEGIERVAQRDELVALSCPFGQGFYFSVPLQEEDFRWLLREHPTLPQAERP